MKNQIILLATSVLVISSSFLFLSRQYVPEYGSFKLENRNNNGNYTDKARIAKENAKYRFDRLKDENSNLFPSYFINAKNKADAEARTGIRSAFGLQWQELGPDNIGGRTRAILIDKRDTTNNTIYAGGVSGGMWKSLDGGNTWNRLTWWNEWLAISCIAQAPAPDYSIYIGTGEGLAEDGVFPGSSLLSGIMGNGIFKLSTMDTGILLAPDIFSDSSQTLYPTSPWAAVNRIAINPIQPTELIAATLGGLYQSMDAGNTWSHIVFPTNSNIHGYESIMAADVKWSGSGEFIYASFLSNGISEVGELIMSSNGGQTWNLVTGNNNPGYPTTAVGRIEIAIAPNYDSIVYLSIANTDGSSFAAFRTGDAGSTWASIAAAGPLFDPMGSNKQGGYDNVIAVNPANPNKVYLAGVNFYTWSDSTGMQLADAGLGSSDVNPNYIHPDKHTIVFGYNNPDLMYIGCDGGIYRSVNAASGFPFPNYTVINRGYAVTQNYGIAAAITGQVFGGSQDNGTNYVSLIGNTKQAADELLGGDGFFTAISHLDPRFFFGEIYYAQLYRSAAFGTGFAGFYDIKVDPRALGTTSVCSSNASPSVYDAPFCTPFLLSETKNALNGYLTVAFGADTDYPAGSIITVTSATASYTFQATLSDALAKGDTIYVSDPVRSRMFITSACGVWATSDALNLGRIPHWFGLLNNSTVGGESFAATRDGNILYMGTGSFDGSPGGGNPGYFYRFPNLNAHCDTATYPKGDTIGYLYPSTSQYSYSAPARASSIEGVAVDPYNNNHVAAVVAGFSSTNEPRVYESQDGGVTWKADTTGLPNMPVYSVVIHDLDTIIIGSELGVWSWDGSSWHEENNGFPRMPVYRMIETGLYTDDCPVIYVGTHGRGMWRCTTITPAACNTATGNPTGIAGVKDAQINGLNIFPNPVHSNSTHVSLMVDASTGLTLRVFDMTGRMYEQKLYNSLVPGQNLFDLEVSGLASGTYLLAATTAGNRTQSKLFVVSK